MDIHSDSLGAQHLEDPLPLSKVLTGAGLIDASGQPMVRPMPTEADRGNAPHEPGGVFADRADLIRRIEEGDRTLLTAWQLHAVGRELLGAVVCGGCRGGSSRLRARHGANSSGMI